MIDLVVVSNNDVDISVLLGNGDGTFQPATNYATSFPTWAAVADFNDDGYQDMAVANFGSAPGVTVFNGKGDGTFSPGVFYSVGNQNRFIAVSDFNGDHRPDIAVPSFLYNNVAILLNTGIVSFSPTTPVTFRGQLLRSEGAPQLVRVTNHGSGSLSIFSIQVAGEFAAKSTCGNSIAPGSSCAIEVVFVPKSLGEKLGTASILDSASTRPQVISLSGQATIVKLSDKQLLFGGQKVGTRSAPRRFQITNTGGGALELSKIAIDGEDASDFSQTSNCPNSLNANSSCEVSVIFGPTKKGPRSATIDIVDSGGASPQSVEVSGAGS